MKNLKKILSLVLCLMMAAVLLTGCSKSLKGEWELVEVEGDDELAAAMSLYVSMGTLEVEFTEDEMIMKMSILGQNETQTLGYELDGKKILTDDGAEMTYKISGKKLTLTQEGVDMIFERK